MWTVARVVPWSSVHIITMPHIDFGREQNKFGIGFMPVFDSYDKALTFAGDPNLVKEIREVKHIAKHNNSQHQTGI